MTIGAYGFDPSAGQNSDFVTLVDCHKIICETLKISPNELEISMGMSSDYEHAVSK